MWCLFHVQHRSAAILICVLFSLSQFTTIAADNELISQEKPSIDQASMMQSVESVVVTASAPSDFATSLSCFMAQIGLTEGDQKNMPLSPELEYALERAVENLPFDKMKQENIGKSSLWMALCLERSLHRSAQESGMKEILDEYRSLTKHVTDSIMEDFSSNSALEGETERCEYVEKRLKDFEGKLIGKINAYQSDPLCPGFRVSLDDKVRTDILRKFEESYTVTRFITRGRSTEELSAQDFSRKFDAYLRNVANLFLFAAFMNSMDIDLAKHERLGNIRYTANSADLNVLSSSDSWPAILYFRVKQPGEAHVIGSQSSPIAGR
jgi:hypothetical protein